MHWGLQFGTYFKVLGRKAITHIYIVIKDINKAAKGQLILKANCQVVNSSKKNEQMNSFLLLCNVFLFIFWKNLKTPRKPFEII